MPNIRAHNADKTTGNAERTLRSSSPSSKLMETAVDEAQYKLGSDLDQAAFDRHATLLGDPRMSRPSSARQRSQLVLQLQRDYGNKYVQRLVDRVQSNRRQAARPERVNGTSVGRNGRQQFPAAMSAPATDPTQDVGRSYLPHHSVHPTAPDVPDPQESPDVELVQREELTPAPRVETEEIGGLRQGIVMVMWTSNREDFMERLIMKVSARLDIPDGALSSPGVIQSADNLYGQLLHEDYVEEIPVRVQFEVYYNPNETTLAISAAFEIAGPSEPPVIPELEEAPQEPEAPAEKRGLPPGTTPELLMQRIQAIRSEMAKGRAEQLKANSFWGKVSAGFVAETPPHISGWSPPEKYLEDAEKWLAEDPPDVHFAYVFGVDLAERRLATQRQQWDSYMGGYSFGADVVSPVGWKALELFSMGMVDEALFEESMQASKRGFAFQIAMVTKMLADRLFGLLTFGGGPAGMEAAMDYWLDHPDQDPLSRLAVAFAMYQIEGGIAAAEALLPIQEIKVLFEIGEDTDGWKLDWKKAEAFFNMLLKCALLYGGAKSLKGGKAEPSAKSKGGGKAPQALEAEMLAEAEMGTKTGPLPERLRGTDKLAPGGGRVEAGPAAGRPAMPTGILDTSRFVVDAKLTKQVRGTGVHEGKVVLEDTLTGNKWLFKEAAAEPSGTVGELVGMKPGEGYRRQVGSAKVGEMTGQAAPESHVVSYKGKIGSLQLWLEGFEGQFKTLEQVMITDLETFNKIRDSQMYKDQAAFEHVVANMDAHRNNVIVEFNLKGEVVRLHSIDMDITFPSSEVRYALGRPLDPHMKPLPDTISPELLEILEQMKRREGALERVLSAYFETAEVKGMLTRLNQILEKVDSGEIKVQETSPAGGMGN